MMSIVKKVACTVALAGATGQIAEIDGLTIQRATAANVAVYIFFFIYWGLIAICIIIYLFLLLIFYCMDPYIEVSYIN